MGGLSKLNITEDLKRMAHASKSCLPDERMKKIRMLKWFQDAPFHQMLDYSDQKNIELQAAERVPSAETPGSTSI